MANQAAAADADGSPSPSQAVLSGATDLVSLSANFQETLIEDGKLPMGDLEKLVAEKLQQVQQESQQRAANYRDPFAEEKNKELSNLSKAEKILTFAEPVLREFARQIKAGFRYKHLEHKFGRDVLACYEIYRTNSLGFRKGRATIEVVIGIKGEQYSAKGGVGAHYSSGYVIYVGDHPYGEDVPANEINESWLLDIVARTYEYEKETFTRGDYSWT